MFFQDGLTGSVPGVTGPTIPTHHFVLKLHQTSLRTQGENDLRSWRLVKHDQISKSCNVNVGWKALDF